MGDLVATCISEQSRNRHVGEELGKGRTIQQIIADMNMVAEGVKTSKVVMELAAELRRRDADRRAGLPRRQRGPAGGRGLRRAARPAQSASRCTASTASMTPSRRHRVVAEVARAGSTTPPGHQHGRRPPVATLTGALGCCSGSLDLPRATVDPRRVWCTPVAVQGGRSTGGSAPTTAGTSRPARSPCASVGSTPHRSSRRRCACPVATPCTAPTPCGARRARRRRRRGRESTSIPFAVALAVSPYGGSRLESGPSRRASRWWRSTARRGRAAEARARVADGRDVANVLATVVDRGEGPQQP